MKGLNRNNKIFIFLGLAIAVVSILFYFKNGIYITSHTDGYYYLSLADSLLQNGELRDMVSTQSKAPLTLQNALPVFLAFLLKIGFSYYSTLKILVVINYLLWSLALIPFLKLLRFSEIRSEVSKNILILGYLAANQLLIFQLLPITDGIFNAGSILLVFLLYDTLFAGKKYSKKKSILRWLGISVLSVFLVHFSIRILVYFIAALLTLLIVKNQAKVKNFFLLLMSISLTIISLCLTFIFIDTSRIFSQSNQYFFSFFDNIKHFLPVLGGYFLIILDNLSDHILSINYFYPPNWLYTSSAILFLFFLAYSLYYGIKNKLNYFIFFSIVIFTFIILILLLPSQKEISEAAVRYMIASTPLFWILAFKFKWTKIYISIVIAIYIFSTIALIAFTKPHPLPQYLKNQNLRPTENTILITTNNLKRLQYVLLNSRNSNDNFCDVDIENKNKLWIFGDRDFREARLADFTKCHKVNVVETNNLTPKYNDQWGNGVFEYLFN